MDGEPGSPFALNRDIPAVLECTGEFGAELNSFLPFVYWLHQAGLMEHRKVCTYRGMRAFYCFLDDDKIIEKSEPRRYVYPHERPDWLPNRNDHASRRMACEMFPDYRARFGGDARFACDRNLIVIHNKFSSEWGSGPVNFIPPQTLARLIAVLREHFRIVYIRPGIVPPADGYSHDQQRDLPFPDLAVLRRFPEVTLFDDVAASVAPGMPYNEVKLRLYAHTHFHLTVQGGNAHMAALFSGGVVSIMHRFGQEICHSYRGGHFSYAANPAPTYLICRTLAELLHAAEVMQTGVIVQGRVLLPPEVAASLDALSPNRQCGIDRMYPKHFRAA